MSSAKHTVTPDTIPHQETKAKCCTWTTLAMAILLTIVALLSGSILYLALYVTENKDACPPAVPLGNALVDTTSQALTGSAVKNFDRMLTEMKTLHEPVKRAGLKLIDATAAPGRRLSKDAQLEVTFEVEMKTVKREDVPKDARVEEAQSGKQLISVSFPDSPDHIVDYDCTATSCSTSLTPDAASGRALRMERRESQQVRYVCEPICELTCTVVTRLLQVVFITWVCEPLADWICGGLLGRGPNATSTNQTNAYETCVAAVASVCGGEVEIGHAHDAVKTALMTYFERFGIDWLVEPVDGLIMSALDFALGKLSEVITPEVEDWTGEVANTTVALLNTKWVERTEELCDNVCTESCTALWVTIIDWVKSWCYPADAPVRVLDEEGTPQLTPMAKVRVGDMVETAKGFEPVVLQGHASMRSAVYVRLTFDSNHSLELSPDHYLRLSSGEYLLSKDARIGMQVLVRLLDGSVTPTTTPATIQRVEPAVVREGAFNPYTPSGTIIVGDVVGSCHSSWFLEGSTLIAPRHVPAVYQALLAPVRAIHRLAPTFSRAFADSLEGRQQPLSHLGVAGVASAALGVALASGA